MCIRDSPTIKWILGITSAFLVVLLSVRQLREAFDFGRMRPVDWMVALVAGFIGVVWFEIYKVRSRA